MASYVQWLAQTDEPAEEPAAPLAPPRARRLPPILPDLPAGAEDGADVASEALPRREQIDVSVRQPEGAGGNPCVPVPGEIRRRYREKTRPNVDSAAKRDLIPEVKPEAKPEVEPEAKPEVEPEAKPEVKPEAKPEVKPEAKPEFTANVERNNSAAAIVKRCMMGQGIGRPKRSRCNDVPLRDMACPQGLPLPPEIESRRHLQGFVQRAVQALDSDALGRGLRGLFPADETPLVPRSLALRVGSLCSGSEMYLTAFPHLSAAVQEHTGLQVTFTHSWSCELVRKKREWIWLNFKPPLVFTDATDLCHPEGAFDDVTQTRQRVPPVDVVVAGFSCKDASRCSVHHTSRLDAVTTGAGTTGRTFQALLNIVSKLRPALVVMENVPSLADKDKASRLSNLDRVKMEFDRIDYAFVSHCFDATDLGCPNMRRRLYMTAWPRPSPYRQADLLSGVAEAIDCVSGGATQVPLDDVLLPETCVQVWNEDAAEVGSHEGLLRTAAWRAQHKVMWTKAPHAADRERYLEHVGNSIAYRALPLRQKDLLLLCLCRHPYPGPAGGVVLLSPSAQWTRIAATMPTQLPKSVFWILDRNRLQLGVEAVALQGADVVDLPACRPHGAFTDKFLQDLAGNAFHVFQFSAWLLVCFARLPLAPCAALGV